MNRHLFGIVFLLITLGILAVSTATVASQDGTPTSTATSGATFAATGAPTLDFSATATQIAQEPHQTVRSVDGHVTLLILDKALPANVAASAIKITPIKPPGGSPTPDGQAPLLAYQLEPDGLQFSIPALIRITVAAPTGGSIPMLETVSGQHITALNPTRVEFDPQAKQFTLTAPIAHFSGVSVLRGAFVFDIQIAGSPSDFYMTQKGWGQTYNKIIGDNFPVEADITINRNELSNWSRRASKESLFADVEAHLLPEWQLTGRWFVHEPNPPIDRSGGYYTDVLSDVIAPEVVSNSPAPTLTKENQFQTSRLFSCVKVSLWTVLTYEVTLDFNVVYTYPDHHESIVEYIEEIRLGRSISCKNLVTKFVAHFVQKEFATHYTVTAKDPDGEPLTYEWSNTNGCGKFNWTSNSPEAVWVHPDSDAPGACPMQAVHPGTIKVEVKSKRGADQIVQYFGGSDEGTMIPQSSNIN